MRKRTSQIRDLLQPRTAYQIAPLQTLTRARGNTDGEFNIRVVKCPTAHKYFLSFFLSPSTTDSRRTASSSARLYPLRRAATIAAPVRLSWSPASIAVAAVLEIVLKVASTKAHAVTRLICFSPSTLLQITATQACRSFHKTLLVGKHSKLHFNQPPLFNMAPSIQLSRRGDITDAKVGNTSIPVIAVVGFGVAGSILLFVIIWVSLSVYRKRAKKKREEARGAAFLTVKGVMKESVSSSGPLPACVALPSPSCSITSLLTSAVLFQ